MRTLFILLFILICVQVRAQIYPFRNYTIIDGLPESHVNGILEDHNSYIWFATEGGACKFDGKNFINFTTEHGLLSNNITSIIEDSKKNIWLASRVGVSRFDGEKFYNYTTKNGLVFNDVYQLYEDNKHNIWFCTTKGLSKFDGVSFTNYKTKDGLPSNEIGCIKQDIHNNIWIGTANGLSKFDGKTFKNYGIEDGLPSSYINSIALDEDGDIWVATGNGLVRMNADESFSVVPNMKLDVFYVMNSGTGDMWTGTPDGVKVIDKEDFIVIDSLDKKNGLPNSQINFIIQDQNQNYWFGTNYGASKLSNRRFNILSAPEVNKKAVTSIIQDDNNNIWFGTDGGGLIKYDGKTFKGYTTSEGLTSDYIKCLYQGSKGDIWIGTMGGGMSVFDGTKFTNFSKEDGINNYVFTILEDKDRNIWIGTDGGVVKYDGVTYKNLTHRNGLSDNYVRCSLLDTEGNVWFGTYGGLSKYSAETKTFENFTTKNGLANNLILSMTQDKKGYIWLATENGLCKMKSNPDPKSADCFECYSKKDKLTSQNLWSVVDDLDGNIWVGHRSGIEKFDPVKKEFKYFGYVDGFKLIQTFPNSIAKDKDGNIWFGAFDGVVKYDPKRDKKNYIPPTTHITNVKLFNKPVDWRKFTDHLSKDFDLPELQKDEKYNVKLSYNQNNISFEFIGIHFTIPERVKYKYKLEGFDKEWSDLSSQTFATYTNLKPGAYNFKLKATNSDGISNKRVTEFKFYIDHPYWEQWWFYAAELAFFLTLLILSLYMGRRKKGSKITLILSIVTLLIAFEFLNVYFENYIESIFGNIPLYKIIANVILASILAPVEHFLRKSVSLKKRNSTLAENPDIFNGLEK